MRSFPIKAALAAALVSTSIAGAYAAGTIAPMSPMNDDAMSTGSSTGPAPQAMQTPHPMQTPQATHEARKSDEAYRPRFALLVHEINAADHRIAVDRHHGYLNEAEFRRLESQAHAIRESAIRTAEDHHGALPRASYHTLQLRVQDLDHKIHREATHA